MSVDSSQTEKPEFGQLSETQTVHTRDPESQVETRDTNSTTSTSLFSGARWREVARSVREQTGRLAEQLGRPASHGEHGLGSSLVHPEELGSTEDDKLAAIFRSGSQDTSNEGRYQMAVNEEAKNLMRGLSGLRHRNAPATPEKDNSSFPESDNTTLADHTPADVEAIGNTPQPGFSGGVLSALLQLQANQMQHSRTDSLYSAAESDHESSQPSLPLSGTITPTPGMPHAPTSPTPAKQKLQKWYKKSNHTSTASLVQASMNLGHIGSSSAWANTNVPKAELPNANKKKKKGKKIHKDIKLTIHIADIIMRQRYIMLLCRAMMKYGAPSHRLEEYMQMTARVLDIDAQFLYLPSCMIMSFDDRITRTAEVKLIRVQSGLDLGRLEEVHHCYKRVTHDMVDMQTAISELTELMERKPRYPVWLVILLYGLGSAAVGPFSFSARPIDLPIIFILGCCVGFMQLVLAPLSALYSNVFEVTAAILVSFLARAFGSIRLPGHTDPIFCYASITESSIALILPGFSVLTSSLELQSHQIIAGSIRLVYTILYSLFLGYGVTVGTTIYGAIDSNATRDTTCARESVWGSSYTQHFPFVAVYCLIAALINQSTLKKTPMMVLIGTAGYVTNYFSTQKLGSSSEVANTVGAFTIGFLANLYSRLWHGNAVSSTIPGIFTLVPSGLASSGSILSAIEYSDSVKSGRADTSGSASGSSLTSLGFGMIQTAIGITVGLFLSALIVYPHGKRRSGLFSL
ncbi:hypothetical protein P175DRAFT_0502588 [Aspergillus ochraceoroseus IBT 24754]|uniref:DUF1212 domain membrane protein n=3 Tax=Aspergillus subgen. Nidulantes TaxID=2720870 RepID=A0A0F8UBI5_9EURO|nr:uncharacterized protein P175DRAFT_0502588 [Aspergillus ochraceoroseus IBT 24754]KKK16938.1 DUF1212 domain membrane protein [Aspergillus rambellii]KKK23514.1 DUF1212 domain membrane protein [Aspergillus ochraceoroseus]PTU19069.1 hypothetical protein P175DRAFT_0502588 [Aspergillus ochraceoroseus IBT 24754]